MHSKYSRTASENVAIYAAYGSNLHPVRLIDRTPTARLKGTARVPGYSLRFHKRSMDGSGKCSILPGGDGVYCAIYEMSAGDRRTLDDIEGKGYDEISLDVPGFGSCFSYIAQPDFVDDRLAPYDWYKALVIAGTRLHDFPDDYIRRIDALRAPPDPDPGRRAGQWALVRKVITAHC